MFNVFRCPFENQFNYSVLKCFTWGGVVLNLLSGVGEWVGGLTEAGCFSTYMCQREECESCLISTFSASMYDEIQCLFCFYPTWTESFSKPEVQCFVGCLQNVI